MEDKLVLRKGDKSAGYAPIFVSVEAHQKVKQIAAESQLSMRDVVQAMIRFSIDHIEIVGEDEWSHKKRLI